MQDKLKSIIDGLPKAFDICPIKAHGSHAKDTQKQIRNKLARLQDRLEVVIIGYFVL